MGPKEGEEVELALGGGRGALHSTGWGEGQAGVGAGSFRKLRPELRAHPGGTHLN